MNATYKLVELVKIKTGIESDYGIAKKFKFTKSMVSNWKTAKAEASVINTLKLMKAAGISIDDAINLMTQTPANQDIVSNTATESLYIM